MHTRIDVALCHFAEQDAIMLMDEIYNETIRIELMTDRFNYESKISLINRVAANEPCRVNDELFSIISDCLMYYDLSSGAFDITIQSLNNYKGGILDIILNSTNKTIFFKNTNVQIDVCGFIKGYMLDKTVKILIDKNCNNALINFGNSSIRAMGNHPNGNGWKVNIPESGRSITLFDQCLTSSGNSDNHFHIIQPQTGEISKRTDTVSVLTQSAAAGEVLSTALYVCEPENRHNICRRLKGSAVSS